MPLFENNAFYVLGMLDPERAHAVMIVLKRHVETPFEITAAEWSELEAPLAFAKAKLAEFKPVGFTIGWNVGHAAGQTLQHVHLHVICRFEDDRAHGLGISGLIRSVNKGIPLE